MTNINDTEDMELDTEALGEVSGGGLIDEVKKKLIGTVDADEHNAFCKHCGQKVHFVRSERKMGGNVSIYVCRNRHCIVFGRERTNLQVQWADSMT
ncbi:hypothetical protein SAMN02910353_02025 [Ruminococcus sp. YRD2003]|uniref:hypothetical protein n=1 Tax=Ruminococcus sp. YRD2003 TaxID=1452313 RepID=UPI0008BE3DCC|nr:hypothetical protein SAMN02910353_02025 [Ruminococcus flavefaciens]